MKPENRPKWSLQRVYFLRLWYLVVQETALEKCQQENTNLQTTVKNKEEEVLNVYFNIISRDANEVEV